MADALRCGPVVVLDDHRGHRREAPALVVGPHRRRHHEESRLRRRVQADLVAAAEQQRPHVHRAARAVGRQELDVLAHDHVDGALEHLQGDLGQHQAAAAADHALMVQAVVEDACLPVLAMEDLLTLEDGLPVVQHVGPDGELHAALRHEHGLRPAVLLVPLALDVAVEVLGLERQARPVQPGLARRPLRHGGAGRARRRRRR
mmetsp:Transcript_86089/g.267459  ORF Transcript_86089/g.267459 Transcript_86089/m.267459 type:complete len:203 (+) Transcript_86089:639-1247(+)